MQGPLLLLSFLPPSVEPREKPLRILYGDFFDIGRIEACGPKACQWTQIGRREGIIGPEDKPVDAYKVGKKPQWLRSVYDRVINHLLRVGRRRSLRHVAL